MWKLLKISAVTDDMKVKRSKEGGATEGRRSTCKRHQVLMPSQQCLIIFLCVSAHRGPFQTDTEMRPSHVGHKQPLMSMGITRHPIKTQLLICKYNYIFYMFFRQSYMMNKQIYESLEWKPLTTKGMKVTGNAAQTWKS